MSRFPLVTVSPLSWQNIHTILTPLHFVIERSLTVTGTLVTFSHDEDGPTPMTYRDSGSLRAPTRPPQHAAPFDTSGRGLISGRLRHPHPHQGQAHQALRLVVTAGMWAAGLCLVIGSIALVVAAAGPNQSGSRLAAQSGPASQAGTAPEPRPGLAPGSQTLAAFAGRGNATTRQFSVAARSQWLLRWRYSCPAGLRTGQFIVAGTAANEQVLGASVTENGSSGHGTSGLSLAAGRHSLVVISTCSWTMTVVRA